MSGTASPFSALESADIATELPLMSSVAARHGEVQALAGHAVMVTDHLLSDLAHLVDCLARMGALLEAMTLLQKDYRYRLRHRVAGHLDHRGVRMVSATDVEAAIREHTRCARRDDLRCLALDDGGYIGPALVGQLSGLADSWDGIVEQTRSGIYRLDGLGEMLPFSVFSVAQSRMRGRIESYWVAEKAVTTALGLMPPAKIEGQPSLVAGYGNVGTQIAAVLRDRRMRVAVYDNDILQLIEAHEHGYLTSRCLPDLIAGHAPLLVLGATGRTSLTTERFRRAAARVLPRQRHQQGHRIRSARAAPRLRPGDAEAAD
jgi:S-adenosylhomocysteine hydrolase